MRTHMTRRTLIRSLGAGAVGASAVAVLAACGETAPTIVTKEVAVKETVIKEVPVETIVTKTEVKEVPVDRVVTQEKIVTKEIQVQVPVDRVVTRVVEVEKVVEKTVVKEVIVEAMPQKGPQPPIQFMNYWSRGNRWETMKVGLEIFDKKHPEIQYDLIPLPPRFYQEKSAIMFAAGTVGDLLVMNGGQMFQFEGNLLPLNDIAPKLGVNFDDYVLLERIHADRPSVWTNAIAGTFYAFPFMIGSVGGWYYNVDIVEGAGLEHPDESWTWDIQDDALKQMTDPEVPQFGTWNRNNTEVQLFERIAEAGGKHFNEVDRPYLTAGFDDAESVASFERWMNYIHVDGVAPPPGEIAALGLEGVSNPFLAGRIGMLHGGIHTPGNYDAIIKDRFTLEIMPTPKPPGGENWYINNQLGHFITRYSQHRGSEENTITLAAFLSGSEFQSLVANWRGAVPTTKEVINSDAWLKPIAGRKMPNNMHIINNNLFDPNVYGNHCFDGWSEWFWNIISAETETAWIGEKPPGESLLDLAEDTNKFMASLVEA